MRSPILDHIAEGLTKLGRRGSHLLKDLIEVEMVELSDDELDTSTLEEPGLHEVAGFGSLVLELPTPPRDEIRPEVTFFKDNQNLLQTLRPNHLRYRETVFCKKTEQKVYEPLFSILSRGQLRNRTK